MSACLVFVQTDVFDFDESEQGAGVDYSKWSLRRSRQLWGNNNAPSSVIVHVMPVYTVKLVWSNSVKLIWSSLESRFLHGQTSLKLRQIRAIALMARGELQINQVHVHVTAYFVL